jgi:hypothetical protein
VVSFELRQTLKLAARILMVAAVVLPYTGFPQPAFEPVAKDERQQEIVEKIQEEQALNGPYSSNLLNPLRALGLLYQESGHDGLAVAAIDRALQVIRANSGLRSLDQAPLIRQSILIEEARGDFAAAWDLEQELLTLARRHPDDLRTVPILHEIADKRIDVLERYVAGEFPPQISLGCYYDRFPSPDEHGSCSSGSRGVVVQAILSEAQRNYFDAISVMLRHELYSSGELRELEMELLRSSYPHGRYYVGRQSLRRLLAYDVANSEPWLTRIDALVRIADWDLLFASGRITNESALEMYEQAYEQLQQKGIAQASIEQIFSPKTPIVLPTFMPNRLVSEGTQDSTGYIDVVFDVTKYGASERIEILNATTNVTDAAKGRLVRLISRSRFRPRVTDGQFADTSPIVVRYYLNEVPP